MSDRIARIFVDSNYRTNIEDSYGNSTIDLPLGVLIESGSHLRVEGLVISHAWPTLDIRNSHLFLREVVGGVNYHRVIRLAWLTEIATFRPWPSSCSGSSELIRISRMGCGVSRVVMRVC